MSDEPITTDPMSAAWAYRTALEDILKAPSLMAAQKRARSALRVTVERPRSGHVEVVGSFGAHTQQAIVTFSMTQKVEQLPASDARKVAGDILEQASMAEQDGALLLFLRHEMDLDMPTIGRVIAKLRAFRARARADLRGMGLADDEPPPSAPRTA